MGTPPEDKIYCGDTWCDGDHTFSGQHCDESQPDEPTPDEDDGITEPPC